MADTSPPKRVLPARERRASAAKRRAISPALPTSSLAARPATPSQPTGEVRVKRKYTKRTNIVHVSTPTRSASAGTSNADDVLPTRLTSSRPLPVTPETQPDTISIRQYQSIADSAILAASLQRSRMQWLYDGIFKKYWTKPMRRKGIVEQPPNNPDAKSMQKLGNATLTIEPHTLDVTFFAVREPVPLSAPAYKHPIQPVYKSNPPTTSPLPSKPQTTTLPAAVTQLENPAPDPTPKISPTPEVEAAVSSATPSSQLATPPATTTKTTDPVIQMLAARAASDNNLKELMKVVATSRATPDQLKEFQAHIDEINIIVKRQDAEKTKAKKKAVKVNSPAQMPSHPMAAPSATYHNVHRNSPLGPGPGTHFASYPAQPRPEPVVKHIVMEFTSPLNGQAVSNERWLFPENAVLDLVYGGTEMTCSFLVERKGSDILATMRDLTSEEMQNMTSKWQAGTEYYQTVTMMVRATQHRIIETIARSARPLPEVQKYMQEVMDKKTRAPKEFLIHRLPRDKPEEFVDSAVELSAEEDELRDAYPM